MNLPRFGIRFYSHAFVVALSNTDRHIQANRLENRCCNISTSCIGKEGYAEVLVP